MTKLNLFANRALMNPDDDNSQSWQDNKIRDKNSQFSRMPSVWIFEVESCVEMTEKLVKLNVVNIFHCDNFYM